MKAAVMIRLQIIPHVYLYTKFTLLKFQENPSVRMQENVRFVPTVDSTHSGIVGSVRRLMWIVYLSIRHENGCVDSATNHHTCQSMH